MMIMLRLLNGMNNETIRFAIDGYFIERRVHRDLLSHMGRNLAGRDYLKLELYRPGNVGLGLKLRA